MIKRSLAQKRVWRHNSYTGQCVWAIKAFQGMMGGDTLTDAARKQGSVVLYELHKLQDLLKERK